MERKSLNQVLDDYRNNRPGARDQMRAAAADVVKEYGAEGMANLAESPKKTGRPTAAETISKLPKDELDDLINGPDQIGMSPPTEWKTEWIEVAYGLATAPLLYVLKLPKLTKGKVTSFAKFSKRYFTQYWPKGAPWIDHIIFVALFFSPLHDAWRRKGKEPAAFDLQEKEEKKPDAD